MSTWQVQQAEAKFKELLDKTEHDGPQFITRRGEERAVVISIIDFHTYYHGKLDFKTFLLHGGPKFDDFKIERDPECGRDIDLSDTQKD